MAKNFKKQLSGAENRKRAKLTEQKIHQVLVGIEHKSIVDENSDDILETVNSNLSAKQPKTSEINISINVEKFETNLSSLSVDENTCAEKTEIQPVTQNRRINEETTVPKS
ncbi:Integrase catalytic domain-containing protein [Aphis craccivora]|uniref:Integrase catalytic domain-containing protein n=1 Tax=Aphis craccivora TaxID=307492 RepID=A0A6G0VY22_APHCR|nr:Integrase catalytic domain-containing protein [Aphis craccivora]